MKESLKQGLSTLKSEISEGIRKAGHRLKRIGRERGLLYTSLFLIVALAFLIRIQPLFYGAYLDEFDPYLMYKCTKYVVEHGYSAFFSWYDYESWYPYGRDMLKTVYPGTPFITAFFYMIVSFLGASIDIMLFCGLVPAVAGAITVIFVFLTAKELLDDVAGLLAALFIAVNPSHLSRTHYGFFDTETLALMALILTIYFAVMALKKDSDFYTFLAGLSLGFMATNWGAFRFLFILLTAYVTLMIVLGKYSRRLLKFYVIAASVGLFIATQIPRVQVEFISRADFYVVIAGFLLAVLAEVMKSIKGSVEKSAFFIGTVSTLLAIVVTSMSLGLFKSTLGRIAAAALPFLKAQQPIVASVAEHAASTWAAFFRDFGILIAFAIFGSYMLVKRGKDEDIFALVALLTATYAASSMVRLTLLLSPVMVVVAAVGVSSFIKPFTEIAAKGIALTTRRRRVLQTVSRSNGAIVLMLVFLVLGLTVVRGVEASATPPVIMSATLPTTTLYPDWLEALDWIKYNTPKDAVIASWWDYGYYITIVGERISICDNGTLNVTQIKNIALMFVSTEDISIKILKKYNASYVIVFERFTEQGIPQGYGDYAKSIWMMRIAGVNESLYWSYDEKGNPKMIPGSYGIRLISEYAANTTLFKLLLSPFDAWKTTGFEGIKVSEPTYFELVFKSSNSMVFVYKVNYPEGI
mgnify:CR=1 FL=1